MKKQLNVKIPEELYAELDNRPEQKTEIVIASLIGYLRSNLDSHIFQEQMAELKNGHIAEIAEIQKALDEGASRIYLLEKELSKASHLQDTYLSQIDFLKQQIETKDKLIQDQSSQLSIKDSLLSDREDTAKMQLSQVQTLINKLQEQPKQIESSKHTWIDRLLGR
ncbi:MAG: hypothetical protein K8R53_14960 [Bacteroidales bacterium]|nr:hypothetical protein [Bacteroidales bacterium]